MAKIDSNVPRTIPTTSSQPAAKPAAAPATAPAAPPPGGWALKPASTRQAAATTALPTDPKKMDIVCPVLGAMVAEGKVKMAPDGTMKLKDLRAGAAESLKVTKPLEASLTAIGFIANKPGQIAHNMFHREMNVLDLRAGFIKHPGDSAILTGGKFDADKFAALASHAEGGLMTADSFGKAIAANTLRDLQPGQILETAVKGKNFSEIEFAGLLGVFGKTDPQTGKFGIPVEELRAMYQDKKLPTVGEPSLVDIVALQASLKLKADAKLAGTAFNALATATGVSRAGARLTEGDRASTAAGQAAMSAGKSAACPHLNNAAKMPPQVNDAVNAHTQAGIKDR